MRACIKLHRKSIYKAIATKFTGQSQKLIHAHSVKIETKKLEKLRPLELDLCRFHGFAGSAPHVPLKIHRKSIYNDIAMKIHITVTKMVSAHCRTKQLQNVNEKDISD